MIISHSRKFIFIKSLKTAGTSIEAALSNQCGGSDVVVPINNFGHNRDDKSGVVHRGMNADAVYLKIGQHADAPTIKTREPAEVWNNYFKFSITRNPWDRALSYFFWDGRKNAAIKPRKRFYHYLGVPFDDFTPVKKLFTQFIRSRVLENDERFHVEDGPHRYRVPAEGFLENNDRFYTIDNQLCVDFVIRYEHLEHDYNEVCHRIGIPATGLPHLKTGIRKERRPYSDYYTDETREIVGKLHANDVRFFGYRFEQK
jgi:hypothetical protein